MATIMSINPVTRKTLIEESCREWVKYFESKQMLDSRYLNLTKDDAYELYLKKTPAILDYIRMNLIGRCLSVYDRFGFYPEIDKDNNPVIVRTMNYEAKVSKTYYYYAKLIRQLTNSLDIPKTLINFSIVLTIHTIDLHALDDSSIEWIKQYVQDYAKAVVNFVAITRSLMQNEKQVKIWRDMLNSQMLNSAPVELIDIQSITLDEIKKYPETNELYSIVLSMYAAYFITVQALRFRARVAHGLTVEQLIQYPIAYDINNMITESYIAEAYSLRR